MKKIEEYTPYELVSLANTVGVIICKNLNINQQNVIGNFIESVGVNLSAIASQDEYLKNQAEDPNENEESDSKKK